MPLWVPESDRSMAGFASVDVSKALAAGLEFRPLMETVRSIEETSSSRACEAEVLARLTSDR